MHITLNSKNILLISPEPWDHIFVSKHHYAVHLGKRGNKVFFLNPPSNKRTIKKTDFKNVWEIDYKGFPKGLRFCPNILQRCFIKRKYKELQDFCHTKFDIVWSFDNSVFYDFSALPSAVLKISHIVDLNQDFQTARAASTADICIGVSAPIVKKLKSFNEKTFFINHGVEESKVISVALPGENKIKVFCAGNLNIPYLDWTLMLNLIATNPQLDFILAGPWTESDRKNQVCLLDNVYYLGVLKTDELSSYYSLADVLLVAYKADEYKDQLSNPHKIMEYLASGKMIVSTYTDNYKRLVEEGLFLMSNKNEDFLPLFNEAIHNMVHWNSESMQRIRKDFALENTYDKQIDRIVNLLLKHDAS